MVRIFVGIEAEEKSAGRRGHTFSLILYEVIAVAFDVFMVSGFMLLFVRWLRPLRRTCCTGWTLQCGYDELSDAIARAVEVNSHGVSLSMITSLSKMLLMKLGLVGGRAIFACALERMEAKPASTELVFVWRSNLF